MPLRFKITHDPLSKDKTLPFLLGIFLCEKIEGKSVRNEHRRSNLSILTLLLKIKLQYF